MQIRNISPNKALLSDWFSAVLQTEFLFARVHKWNEVRVESLAFGHKYCSPFWFEFAWQGASKMTGAVTRQPEVI